jgi:hypothetical protein
MFTLTVIAIMLAVIFGYGVWAIWRRENAWRREVKRRGNPVD